MSGFDEKKSTKGQKLASDALDSHLTRDTRNIIISYLAPYEIGDKKYSREIDARYELEVKELISKNISVELLFRFAFALAEHDCIGAMILALDQIKVLNPTLSVDTHFNLAGHNDTLFLKAARHGSLGIIQLLAERGANINQETSYSGSALFQASMNQDLDLMAFLFKQNNAVLTSIDHEKEPFTESAYRGKIKSLTFLIENGAASSDSLHKAISEIYSPYRKFMRGGAKSRSQNEAACLNLCVYCYLPYFDRNANPPKEYAYVDMYYLMSKEDAKLYKMIILALNMQPQKHQGDFKEFNEAVMITINKTIELYNTGSKKLFSTSTEGKAIFEAMKNTLDVIKSTKSLDPRTVLQYLADLEQQSSIKKYISENEFSPLSVAVFSLKSLANATIARQALINREQLKASKEDKSTGLGFTKKT